MLTRAERGHTSPVAVPAFALIGESQISLLVRLSYRKSTSCCWFRARYALRKKKAPVLRDEAARHRLAKGEIGCISSAWRVQHRFNPTLLDGAGGGT